MEEPFSRLSRVLNLNKEPQTEKEMVRQYVKVLALEACEEQHAGLMSCYQRSWFPSCSEEQSGFWNCYKTATITLRKKYGVYD